jgi:predicted HTH transcriptional regulator
MTPTEFIELIAVGERPGVEFKNARGRKDRNFLEVVRAVIAMANRRDGGLVFIGVANDGVIEGLTTAQLATWETADYVRDGLAPWIDPSVYVDVEAVAFEDGKTCIVLRVQEFDLVPVLCAKDGKDDKGLLIIRAGACYVRSRSTPPSPAPRMVSHLSAKESRSRTFASLRQGKPITANAICRDVNEQPPDVVSTKRWPRKRLPSKARVIARTVHTKKKKVV